jgi:hypothetical protein
MLHEAGGVALPQRATVGRERNLAGLVLDARGLELLLGLADPGDFRVRVDDPGHGIVIDVAGWPAMHSATMTPSSMPLCASIGPGTTSPTAQTFGRLVRHCASTSMKPRSLELQADGVAFQAIGVRNAADRNDQTVALQHKLLVLVLVFDGTDLRRCVDLADLRAQLDASGPAWR